MRNKPNNQRIRGRKAESVNVYDMRDSKSTLKNLMQGMYLISFILNITEIFTKRTRYTGNIKKAVLSLSIAILSVSCFGQTQISTEAELRTFASAVNSGTTYEGQTVTLENDIALTAEWTPIGKSGKPFKGTFEGNGHKISNLHITRDIDYTGLFGYINGGTIQNVIVYGEISVNNKRYIAGICGKIENNSKIENCHFIGEIEVKSGSGDKFVGGVVGGIINGGRVNKCSSNGLIYGNTNNNGVKCVGGVVGRCGDENNDTTNLSYPQSYITNCINLSDVYGFSSVGGIIAYASYRTTVENCLNCGNINGFTPSNGNKYFGGIIGGYYAGMQVYNCLSAGTVNNDKPSAAIGLVRETLFPDRCPKVNIYYDYQRMWKNHSRHGTAKNTDEIIDGALLPNLEGWVCDGGYPYPKDFTYDSVIMVAKSYALFSNDEKYDAIETDFTVSNFTGTSWTSRQGKVSVRTPNIVPIDTGNDTLVVNYGSYYKNILLNIESYDPLPIRLYYFKGTPSPHGNLLKWATAWEQNNCEFDVFRAKDLINPQWVSVTETPIYVGSDTYTGRSYQLLDRYQYDTTYYMLVQSDCDGTFEKFTSEYIVCIQDKSTDTFEKPYIIFGDRLQIVGGSEICRVSILNVLGQVVEEFSLNPYQQREILFHLQGTYLITSVYEHNGKTIRDTEKIVK